MSLTIPNLPADASVLDAAMAYATAGWYVLPVRRGQNKHPGSVVGKGWQHQSSRDVEQLVAWWAGTNHGIALHVGRSGAVVFDVDEPEQCPPVLVQALGVPRVPFQSTRTTEPRRGHYVYAAPEGRILGNGLGQLGGAWGEVRGRNGVIIVEPSEHAKAGSGARYAWEQTGPVPLLPDVLADLLPDGQASVDAVTDREVVAFLSEHVEATRPGLLDARLRHWTAKFDAGESRHSSLCGYLKGALDEARCGYYLAADAVERMKALFVERATTSKPGDPAADMRSPSRAAHEFDSVLAWAVGQSLVTDLSSIRQRLEAGPACSANHPDVGVVHLDNTLISTSRGDEHRDVPLDAAELPDADDVGEGTDEAEPTLAELIEAKYPVLDWHELWSKGRSEPDWLCEPLLAAGKVVALYSPAKTGKSLLCLEIAAALAAGRPVLGNARREPVRVLYVDLENSEDDLLERLIDLGYVPDDLANLRYLSFPSLPALDSRQGGVELLAVAKQHDAALVVLDTVSRVISGEEDKSDTFRALYRHALMPLKAEGRAVLRLDHSGKDISRGQRGSTGKVDDVDAVWSMVKRTPNVFDLRRTHSRSRHGAEHVTLTRLTSPLRHEIPDVGAPSEADEIARQLDLLGVPSDAGRPACRDALKASGITAPTAVLAQAIRQRKEAANCPRTARTVGPDEGDDDPFGADHDADHEPRDDGRGQSADSADSWFTGPQAELSVPPPLRGRDRDSEDPRSGQSKSKAAAARAAS